MNKYLIAGFTSVALLAVAVLPAYAKKQLPPPPPETRQMVSINPNGNVQVSGKLLSSTGNTLMISSWGIVFAVDISGAQTNESQATSSTFKVGDMIGVVGNATSSNALVITAKGVRDLTLLASSTTIHPREPKEATSTEAMGSSTPPTLGMHEGNNGDASSTPPMGHKPPKPHGKKPKPAGQ